MRSFLILLLTKYSIIKVTKSQKLRWLKHVVCIGGTGNSCITLVRKPEEKRPLGRSRHRQEENTEMNLRETGCEHVDMMFGSA
jgi:hypothetical protein